MVTRRPWCDQQIVTPSLSPSSPPPPAIYLIYMYKYANLSGDPFQRTQEALEADPGCVMAHCLRGLLAALGQGDPATVSACLEAAERELAARDANDMEGGREVEEGRERERVFAAALRAWSGGRWRQVCMICAFLGAFTGWVVSLDRDSNSRTILCPSYCATHYS